MAQTLLTRSSVPYARWFCQVGVISGHARPEPENASRSWRRARNTFKNGKSTANPPALTGVHLTHDNTTPTAATTMSTFRPGESSTHPFHEPEPLPASIPRVNELGATSAPLKSAAFFIGAYCKEFNGGVTFLENRT